MKKRLIIITLILAAIVTVPIAVYARPGGHGPRGERGHGLAGLAFLGHLDRIKGELELTDAQVDQLKAIFKNTREENQQYREQMHGSFKEVATTLLTNPNDIAGAQAVLDRQANAERALKSNMLTAASKALNVLTPEQRTKLAMHLSERAQRWENRGR